MSQRPRPGIGEWPAWGDEPPELWFAPVPTVPARPPASAPPAPSVDGKARPGLAVPGFILALLGACFCWVPLLGLGSGLFGAVLSTQARRATPPGQRGRGLATVGLVLGCIGVAGGVLWSAIFATIALNRLFNVLYGG